ncbi:MBL fold metallo-hydrolase [Virgibacillus xinjiangensis]|uniref:MBL fold metallo-hydrolase n=1 Tax=Virgibacillus xinjiangensis TaxID=393090 RepID=A0ABV7D013_9BACI
MTVQNPTSAKSAKDLLQKYGLHPVTLDLPFRLDHVNCFMAEGENGWTVIDTGLHNEQTKARWREELSGRKVAEILVTHYHPDHFGFAGGMQEWTGAVVRMSLTDAELGLRAWQSDFLGRLRENYKRAGVPDEIGKEMADNTKDFIPRVTPYPTITDHLEEGENVAIGGWEYEVIFTPGHSDGLVTLFNKENRILLSTDHILPKITPNISYWFHGDPDPLGSYLQSLEKIKKLDAELVVPSHGLPFYGANDRLMEIQRHHDRRLDEAREAIDGGATVYDACLKLFRKDLTVHEVRFAIGETLSHLEYLRHRGQCHRELKNEVYWYYI